MGTKIWMPFQSMVITGKKQILRMLHCFWYSRLCHLTDETEVPHPINQTILLNYDMLDILFAFLSREIDLELMVCSHFILFSIRFWRAASGRTNNSESFCWGARREWPQGICFCVAIPSGCRKFKWIELQQVGFECLYHLCLSPLLNLHS